MRRSVRMNPSRFLAAFTANGIQADQAPHLQALHLKSDFNIGQSLLLTAGLLHHIGQIDILAQRTANHCLGFEVQQLGCFRIEVRDDAQRITHHQSIADGFQDGGQLGALRCSDL